MTDSFLIHGDLIIGWGAHIFFSPLAKITPEEENTQTCRDQNLSGDADDEENHGRHRIIFSRRLEIRDARPPISEFNGERFEFSSIFFRLNDELTDMGLRRSMAAPLDHRLDIFFFSLENCGDRPVGQITNPPSNVIFLSFPLGVVAKVYTLDNPLNDQLGARFSH